MTSYHTIYALSLHIQWIEIRVNNTINNWKIITGA